MKKSYTINKYKKRIVTYSVTAVRFYIAPVRLPGCIKNIKMYKTMLSLHHKVWCLFRSAKIFEFLLFYHLYSN